MAALHPWRTLGVWVVLVVVAFAAAGTMKASSDTATAGTEATTAENLIEAAPAAETAARGVHHRRVGDHDGR